MSPHAPRGTLASIPAVHAGGAAFRPLAREDPERQFRAEGRGIGAIVLVRIPILNDNYAYLFVSGREAVAVDPGEAKPLIDFIREHELSLTRLLVTHHHADHTGGCPALKRATGCTVFGPKDARIPSLDLALEDGDRVKVGAFYCKAIHAPGHTRTHLAYAFRAGAATFLFSGDCLFPAGCGRVVEGTHREMLGSLRKLAAPEVAASPDGTSSADASFDETSEHPSPVGPTLHGDAVLLAGHEYTLENLAFALSLEPDNEKIEKRRGRFRAHLSERGVPPASLVSEESATNPFLRSGDPLLRKALGMEGAGDVEVFAETRRRKDRFLFA